MRAVFTGYDSAWGAGNTGALCDLVLRDDGTLLLPSGEPSAATWDYAVARAERRTNATLNVWSIDQPICVANGSGCRPVEIDLARALMAAFGCGAHSSNLSNPCWAAGARIWDLLRKLTACGFRHEPLAVPAVKEGNYYLECYPHPAILGLFDLDHILKYKVRHRDNVAWQQLVDLLRGLAEGDLPIVNIRDFVTAGLVRNQDNENKLDAIISAYVAAYWWKYGTKRSTMIGDTTTGYIVTPHSERTKLALAEAFDGRQNLLGTACDPPPAGNQPILMPATGRTQTTRETLPDHLPPEPSGTWNGPVTLRATDTTNLWRTSRGTVINEWMESARLVGWRLWIRLIEEDGDPAVLFVPFQNQAHQQGGMRSAAQQMNRVMWHALVVDATRTAPIDLRILYHYEVIE